MRKEVGYREKMASSFLHLSKSSMWLPASTICSYYTLIRCRIRKCTWVKTPEQVPAMISSRNAKMLYENLAEKGL
ncbi:hypothetical protein Y1Q_0004371 [Alligator mississippiensis]|uniref:Uncharacterized protein n=1 Tax=Alligator mississippiensis TaxID=8496 RepID=A0A151MIJ6_ALLMI|nr:hypothetical protein Y1Q_0004371 [Alligator mississippiensis]